MARDSGSLKIADEVPWSETITAYNQAHLTTYLHLIDADDAGAPDAEVARLVLGLDPARDPDRAMRAVASHLRRARWMSETGYRHLLRASAEATGSRPTH